jgi:phosphatidylserine/phosphatidylglycerophosphate/cardiolipin synthase-like enzyme
MCTLYSSCYRLENECSELVMIKSVKDALPSVDVREWCQKYTALNTNWPLVPSSQTCERAPVRLVSSREEHKRTVKALIDGATRSLKVMTCYAHIDLVEHTEILLTLLPEAARRGVRVQIMFDALPFMGTSARINVSDAALHFLPEKETRLRAKRYFQDLKRVAESCPEGSFSVIFFQARCAETSHRVKCHQKIFAADDSVCIVGGSNVIPTPAADKNDCDVVVGGVGARRLTMVFDEVWAEQTGEDVVKEAACAMDSNSDGAVGGGLEESIDWHDTDTPFAVVASRPTIKGNDPILAANIALVDGAKEEVLFCYGFSGLMPPLVDALARASRRGVRVRGILNSRFSCDLRPPRGDLASGARALLRAAAECEVYMSGPRKEGDVREDELSGETEAFVPTYPKIGTDECFAHGFVFLHGKYMVVDRERCSLGTWNAWARSAFHESELNLLVESATLGKALAEKWGEACRLHTARVELKDVEKGGLFAPLGCFVCEGFGDFVEGGD